MNRLIPVPEKFNHNRADLMYCMLPSFLFREKRNVHSLFDYLRLNLLGFVLARVCVCVRVCVCESLINQNDFLFETCV